MKHGSVIAALVLSTGLLGTANAAIKETSLGTLSDGQAGLVGNFFSSVDTFTETFHFTLSSMSTISGWVSTSGLSDASWTLSSGGTTLASGAFGNGLYSFSHLAPGAYTASIFGTSAFNSGYLAQYAVTAVPEAETWLMIAIGFGLVAFQLHRKHKTLRQRALEDSPQSAGFGLGRPALPA